MDLAGLTGALRELVELFSPPTIPIPKLKPGYKHAYDTGPEKPGTVASRPSSLAKGDGGGTQAGVKPKSLGRDSDTKTSQRPKGRDTKTQATPKTKPKAGGKPPSCPGGAEPRMVFGQWRCTGGGSKGAQKAKSRISAKRKAKGKKPKVKVGGLAKLVNKARAALKGLFT